MYVYIKQLGHAGCKATRQKQQEKPMSEQDLNLSVAHW